MGRKSDLIHFVDEMLPDITVAFESKMFKNILQNENEVTYFCSRFATRFIYQTQGLVNNSKGNCQALFNKESINTDFDITHNAIEYLRNKLQEIFEKNNVKTPSSTSVSLFDHLESNSTTSC